MTRAMPLLSLTAFPLALFLALWMGLHRDADAHDSVLAMAVLLSDEREMVYLLTLETGQFRAIEEGNRAYWSPSGRYLGVGRHLHRLGGGGNMLSFAVHDLQNNTQNARNYERGVRLFWPPDEAYLVVEGYVSSGMSGSQGWLSFFTSDNAAELLNLPTVKVDNWMMGERSYLSPRGWTQDGRLLVQDNREASHLYDPLTGKSEKEIQYTPELVYLVPPQVIDSTQRSPDGMMEVSLLASGNTIPLLRDITTGVKVPVPVPPFTFRVLNFAWQPRP